MTTTDTGRKAEKAIVDYLEKQGHKILTQNWRTRWCEIDVVAQKNQTVYFVEVKYRRSSRYGDGLAYITDKKLQQMSFAAEMWVHNHNWTGDYALAAASVSGDNFQITDFFEL